MATDFLTLLNDSNSMKNEETGEITLTSQKFEIENDLLINSECNITSNCDTIISCNKFIITSESVFIKNITFKTTVIINKCSNCQMIDCNIRNVKSDYCMSFTDCHSVELTQINILENEVLIGILFKHTHAIANKLLINGSEKVNIGVIDESSLQLYDSKICNSKSKGINILNSDFEIQNCILSDTLNPAIYIWNSKGKILNNQIFNIKMNGIVVNDSDSVEINNNNINDVYGSAISIINNSKCEIINNSISKISNNGIFVKNKAKINACNNKFEYIECPAIAILMKSKARLFENKIANINSCGIRIINAKKVEIEKNELNNIEDCAISILNTKKCSIKNNCISICKIAAIEVYNNSIVKVFENHLSKLEEYAFLVYTNGEVNAENNTISDVGKSMVNLIFKGGGKFINNKLENCPQQKEGKTSSLYYFNGNGNFSGITNNETKKSESIQFEDNYIENNNLCIKCKKNDRKCFLLNCGHKIYCQKCAEDAMANHEKCPLCRLQIVGINEGFVTDDDTCDICCEKKADCIVMPCGHIGYCHKCLNKWFQNNQRCPYCQIEPVTYSNIQDI